MIRTALILMLSSFIAGCGGGDSDSSTQGQSQIPTGKQVGFEFINTTPDDVDFFIKESASETTLHEVTKNNIEIADEPISQYLHNWSTPTPLIVDISAKDTNTQDIIGTADELVANHGENYWVIAWQDTEFNETLLFTTRQEGLEFLSEDKYAVRIFSLIDTDFNTITNNGMSNSSGTLEKGTISAQQLLDNCSHGLFIDTTLVVDLCEFDAGKSYLLITDGNAILLAAEEN